MAALKETRRSFHCKADIAENQIPNVNMQGAGIQLFEFTVSKSFS